MIKQPIKLIECPRDAMQGLQYFIATDDKIKYLNLLLKVGFHTLDFGSFVSAKVIPQMTDTIEVLEGLDPGSSGTKLLAIVANTKGIEEAARHAAITYLGYPFSISETFQKRNTNSDIGSSFNTILDLLNVCAKHNKQAVIYLSMAFGNPYGDPWNHELAVQWCLKLAEAGVTTIALSDTKGVSTAVDISKLYQMASKSLPSVEIGLHLHSRPDSWKEKMDAAYSGGCRRFDSTVTGYGGCPMASDKLTGNIATENLIEYFNSKEEILNLNLFNFKTAFDFAQTIFH